MKSKKKKRTKSYLKIRVHREHVLYIVLICLYHPPTTVDPVNLIHVYFNVCYSVHTYYMLYTQCGILYIFVLYLLNAADIMDSCGFVV